MNKEYLIPLLVILTLSFFTEKEILALETTWPVSPFGTDLNAACTPINSDTCTLAIMVKYFYDWGIFLGGLAVLISLIFGGFLYLTSAGDPARMREAKDRIFSALIGLVLLFSIYIILNTINPELTTLIPPTFEPPVIPNVTIVGWEESQQSCSYALIYSKTGWKGTSTVIWSGEDPGWDTTVHDNGSDYPEGAKSARFFQKCQSYTNTEMNFQVTEECDGGKLLIRSTNLDTGEESTTTADIVCEIRGGQCYKEGGLCTLELSPWSLAWWGIVQGCGDKSGSTNTSSPNLRLHLEKDEKIECLRLVKTGED